MTRLLLTGIGVAVLLLGAPRAADAAELLRPGSVPTSVAPRLEAPLKGALSRDGVWTDAVPVAQVTPAVPAQPRHFAAAPVHGASPTRAARFSGPASLPRVLPDARAPPA